ncbi:hypothetical protein EDB89DRAFT_2020007 [Lactarius sanguifluus]|nr:hypothetical protein EDB89DRAFT_2020007 [Lactarius sanguifluus]
MHGTGTGVEDEDELDLFVTSTLPVGSEVRHAATAEARCLKRIPQNAEHGLVRTYLEWLISLPWTPPATASDTRDQISSSTPNHDSTWTIMASKR